MKNTIIKTQGVLRKKCSLFFSSILIIPLLAGIILFS